MKLAPKERLAKLGIELPAPVAPVASYVPVLITPPLLFVSGQLPLADGKVLVAGRLGADVDISRAQDAAARCAINILAIVEQWCGGDWDRIVRCVRLGGFFQVTETFFDLPKAMNGASDLMIEALGDVGKHVRTTVGVLTLPMNAVAEVDAAFEIRG